MTEKGPLPGKTPKDDTASVMSFYGLSARFPRRVLAEADAIAAAGVTDADLRGRLDLRRTFVFTCDPESARDYDDALSFETDRKGRAVLGVHIADVSHYVRPGTALDREAFRRSTSVYFPDRVLPMLPETLSNGVCSLVPGEDRLAFSVFLTFDADGAPVARSFAKSVIRSSARFTYAQVLQAIEGDGAGALFRNRAKNDRAVRVVRAVSRLAQTLRARRFAAGALDLDVPESEVVLDAAGEIERIAARESDVSHQMVEECMVAANEAVAKELWSNGVKILARLHAPPDEEKTLMLRIDLKGLGVKAGDLSKPAAFARFLASVRNHPLAPTISTMVLRSMQRAVYDASTIGHFGLAKKHYAHFTSPIRRYPDLTLHRQLAAWIRRAPAKVPPRTLERWARHATECEWTAVEAERALLEIKKYRLLERQIASRETVDYPAVVSKCLPFGCFVDIPALAVSGLVHVSALSGRFVRYNESDGTLSAPGGRSWKPGDRLVVRAVRVDAENRRIDFVPVRERRAHG